MAKTDNVTVVVVLLLLYSATTICLVSGRASADRIPLAFAPSSPLSSYMSSYMYSSPSSSSSSARAAGFGSKSSAATSKKKSKSKSKNKNKKHQKAPVGNAPKVVPSNSRPPPLLPPPHLATADQRMEHIASRVRATDLSSLAPTESESEEEVICVIDNFLNDPFLSRTLRAEAESLLDHHNHNHHNPTNNQDQDPDPNQNNSMVPSQSTRWDEELQAVVAYEKHNVQSIQIEGGPQGYAATPHLVEYIVTLTQHLSQKVAAQPWATNEMALSPVQQTNKLAVCLGDGSHYDKHIDNMGGDDLRKLTALLYLQPPGKDMSQLGGCFCAHDLSLSSSNSGNGNKEANEEEGPVVDSFEPISDRLVLFWSDALVHHVSPSFAPGGPNDYRWALTTWFISDVAKGGRIRTTSDHVQDRHFGTG